MGALWWSYRHLDEHVRRCFVYCSIFPRRRNLERDELVRMWAAAGFARSTNEGEDTEDVCQEYFDELVSASFLQPVSSYMYRTPRYIVHDLLRDLAEKVAGSDHLTIENHIKLIKGAGFRDEELESIIEGSAVEVPPDVRQPVGGNFIYQDDLLLYLAEKVAGSDHLTIENHRKYIKDGFGNTTSEWIIEGSAVEVPPDVRHVFLQTYDAALITEKICKLKNLRTLIIDGVGIAPVEEKVLESIFERLKKLRVFTIAISGEDGQIFSVPASVGQLRHLRYLDFQKDAFTVGSMKLVLPRSLSKLYHMQVLNFGLPCTLSEFSLIDAPHQLDLTSCEDMCDLINLRHVINVKDQEIRSIGRLTSLRTMGTFRVRKEEGYRLKQLRNLNKLGGELQISGLENVESKAEALEANLADKEGLRQLALWWNGKATAEVQLEVLEGLCPPKYLDELEIFGYKGLRYPSWMVGEHIGGPKYPKLMFSCCMQELGPELRGFGTHLRELFIFYCDWVSLPDCMEHLTSLYRLRISSCRRIQSLPTLPQSLQTLSLNSINDVLMSSCKIIGDPNWEKIKHIPEACIEDPCTHKWLIKMGVVTELRWSWSRFRWIESSEPETP